MPISIQPRAFGLLKDGNQLARATVELEFFGERLSVLDAARNEKPMRLSELLGFDPVVLITSVGMTSDYGREIRQVVSGMLAAPPAEPDPAPREDGPDSFGNFVA